MEQTVKVLRPDFEKGNGLVAVVTQDHRTKDILMLAWTDLAGYLETLRTGFAVYFSRKRQRRWVKGEESGHKQIVHSVSIDCDGDALIYHVEQTGGGACHTGAWSCFFRSATNTDLMPAPKVGETEKLPLIDAVVCGQIELGTLCQH